MVDVTLLQKVRKGLGKEAYAPPAADPAAGGMPLTDPAMAAAAGGGMPVDPTMAAGAMPPVDPMAMTPAMPMGGMAPVPGMPAGVDPTTGLPPLDPAAMGGMPMDPGMMGMPPGPEEPETVQVSLDDLRAIFQEVAGGGEAPAEGGAAGSMEERLSGLEEMMALLLTQFGLGEEDIMGAIPEGAEGAIPPMPEEVPAGMPAAEAPVQGLPADFSLLEASQEMPAPDVEKAAEEKPQASEFIRRLRQALNA